jgi:phosphatidylglycerophosphatase A
MNTIVSTAAPETRSVWRNPLHFLAFGFGTGTVPWAPGTFGTLAALPVYILIMDLSPWLYALVTLMIILAAIIICHITAKDLGVHDYPGIVLDEIAGYLVTMLWVPAGWIWIVFGFVLFRLFDIWKPWPIRWVDRWVKGGFGIVLDDLLAGVYAWVIMQLLANYWFYYD